MPQVNVSLRRAARHAHDLDDVAVGIARHADVAALHRRRVTGLDEPLADRGRVVEPEREPPEAVRREHLFHRIARRRRGFLARHFPQSQIAACPFQQRALVRVRRLDLAHPDAVAVELRARFDITHTKLEHRVHHLEFAAVGGAAGVAADCAGCSVAGRAGRSRAK